MHLLLSMLRLVAPPSSPTLTTSAPTLIDALKLSFRLGHVFAAAENILFQSAINCFIHMCYIDGLYKLKVSSRQALVPADQASE